MDEKSRVSKIFDVPQLHYFQSGNNFTGSKNQNHFNYKIAVGEELILQIWHGFLCSEKADIEIEKNFPMDADGFRTMISFLEETYQQEYNK